MCVPIILYFFQSVAHHILVVNIYFLVCVEFLKTPFANFLLHVYYFLQMFQHYNTGCTVHTAQWGGQAAPREGKLFSWAWSKSKRWGMTQNLAFLLFLFPGVLRPTPHPTYTESSSPCDEKDADRASVPRRRPCSHSRERGAATEEGGGAKSCPEGCVHRGDTSSLHPSKCRIKSLCDVT